MPRKKKKNNSYYRRILALLSLYWPLLGAAAFILASFGMFIWNYTLPRRIAPEDRAHEIHTLPRIYAKKVRKIASDSASIKIPILMYHYIEYVQDKKDTIRQSLALTPYVFEEQVKTLKDNGYTFLTMKDMGMIIDGEKDVPEKSVVLTFDDGYRDFYTDAYPILKKYNAKAVAYVVPGFLDKPNYMFTNQVAEIAKDGLVEIGAHTMHHVSLKGMNTQEAEKEITESKTSLENQFNIKVVSFAYPYGSFDEHAVEIAKKAGFKTAVSTVPGIIENPANRFYLFRLRPGLRTNVALTNYFHQEIFSPW